MEKNGSLSFMDFLLRNTAGTQTGTAAPALQHDAAKEN